MKRTAKELEAWAVSARNAGLLSTERAAWVADMDLRDFMKKYGMELSE